LTLDMRLQREVKDWVKERHGKSLTNAIFRGC
jgi:hypothetical protein